MELKGSKTEANLQKAFAENLKLETNIHILQKKLEKKVMNKSLISS